MVLLLLQVPPVDTSLSGADVPIQIVDGPVIAAGGVLTVTVAVVKQPPALV
jgi:hypothetical protein